MFPLILSGEICCEDIMRKLKNIILKIDDFREEKLEDFIADKILAALDTCSKVDELEKAAIISALTAGNAYLATYGVPTLPDDVKKKIADAAVKGLGKANNLLQKQLKKKSNSYLKRKGKSDATEQS